MKCEPMGFSGLTIAVLVALCCHAPQSGAAGKRADLPRGLNRTPSQLLATWERRVHWTTRALEADLTWDGVEDAAVLGTVETAVVVGIIEGPVSESSRHWTLVFPIASDLQDGICGAPEAVEFSVEDATLPSLEEFGCHGGKPEPMCERLNVLKDRLESASRKGAKGIRLTGGDCDAFHIFFDGANVQYWRR
jgi:hypothetical protein